MTEYAIERDIPIPTPAGGNYTRSARPRAPSSPLSVAMLALEVGDSIALPTEGDYRRALGRLGKFPPRQFVARKVPHEGWRLWRTA